MFYLIKFNIYETIHLIGSAYQNKNNKLSLKRKIHVKKKKKKLSLI